MSPLSPELTPDPDVARWPLSEVQRLVTQTLQGTGAEAILFGSWATGRAVRNSDIDVAILPRSPLPQGLLGDLREKLEESRVPYRVDLVDLSTVDPLFRERVLKEGIPWSV